ncbi:amino acid ABC transporter permease [candidate division GN15 bacterium]|uniref:Amino acid ABC transporter permease n=1 Tax=candidate division GN15 bacterium TaxID=2072418 RepID=A0A855X2U5_9BACT|nr:MAG: amino acid ABC transporter permease [candidate division GN15 bacterium]
MTWLVDQFTILGNVFYYLIQTVHWTILISVLAYLIALIFGLVFGILRLSLSRPVRWLASAYVNVIRGVPLLVLIFFIYFGLGKIVNLDRFVAGVLAVGICYGAYLAEIFRSGIQAIDYGQHEAAMSLGMTRWQTMRHIILPQSVRIVVPPAANEFIACLKDSSLVSIIGLRELTRAGREYSSQYFLDFQTWLVVGIIYLILTLTLTQLVKVIERRVAVHGYGVEKK